MIAFRRTCTLLLCTAVAANATAAQAFMPHGHCYFWSTDLISLHAISDALIVLAYYSIPLTLVYFVRRRANLEFHWMFVCFAVFILACGTTHLFEIWNIWHSDYWVAGGVKALTAVASVPTAILLVRLVPQALALPSPGQLRLANDKLQLEVSERKRVEQALQDQNLELEKASQAKDAFLATKSHELRTPLNASLGFAGTLLMKLPGPLSTDQEKQLRTIQSSANHLLSLINGLLDLAKIESGRVDLDVQKVNAGDVVAEVLESLFPLARGKRLTFEVSQPAAPVELLTDRRAFSQILINLASNAIKFTSEGGVRLEIEHAAEAEPYLARVHVVDTGCGIPAELQARLFRPFQRGESAASRRIEGTGLGLHLSNRLAELIGAEITCVSEVGKGSRFTVAIRRAWPQATNSNSNPDQN